MSLQKAKLKLGKGKKLPANQVDTSFKARCMRYPLSCRFSVTDLCIKAIALPTQSITLEKDAKAPTTKRKLTFTDLVTHLKHHNSNVKKGMFTEIPLAPDAVMTALRCVAWPTRAVRSSLGFSPIVLGIALWCVRATDWGRGE